MQSVGGMTLSVSFSRELRIYLPAGLMRCKLGYLNLTGISLSQLSHQINTREIC